MDNKTAFKLAHEMTKRIIKDGDSYQATFGAYLKKVKADSLKKPVKVGNIVFNVILFVAVAAVVVSGYNLADMLAESSFAAGFIVSLVNTLFAIMCVALSAKDVKQSFKSY